MREPESNEEDLYFLHNAPERLLSKYQYFIQFLVDSYVQSGYIDEKEREDVSQNINAKLWKEGLAKIREKYDGRVLLKTYLGVVIKSYCNNEYRRLQTKTQKLAQKSKPLRSWHQIGENTNNILYIEQEKKRLEKLFFLFGKRFSKLSLCLKLYYYIPLAAQDILQYHPEIGEERLAVALSRISQDFAQKDLKELFAALVSIVNDKEGKGIDADSLRRWTKSKITELLELINGQPPTRSYDEETLGILLHYYFANAASEVE